MDGTGSCLADVVSSDADVVPLRHLLAAVDHHVPNDTEMSLRRERPLLLSNILLENIRLDRSPKFFRLQPLPLRHANIHRRQDRCRRVDRHASTHLLQRNSFEDDLHVLQRADRDATSPNLALGARMIRIVPVQSRHVKRNAQPCLTMFEKIMEPLVSVLRGTESGEHPHRPGTPAIHCRIDATQVRIFAWKAGLLSLIAICDVVRSVESADRNVGWVPKILLPLRTLSGPLAQRLSLPLRLLPSQPG